MFFPSVYCSFVLVLENCWLFIDCIVFSDLMFLIHECLMNSYETINDIKNLELTWLEVFKIEIPRVLTDCFTKIQDQNICTHYSRYGICKFGPACRFDHSVQPPYTTGSSQAVVEPPQVGGANGNESDGWNWHQTFRSLHNCWYLLSLSWVWIFFTKRLR